MWLCVGVGNSTNHNELTQGGFLLDQSRSTIVWVVCQSSVTVGNWAGWAWWCYGEISWDGKIVKHDQVFYIKLLIFQHMYITSALQKTDMKAVSLQLALDLLHEKEKRDLITGLKTRTTAGRPNWDKVFKKIQDQKKGKVTVFYCGPPQLAKTLRYKCEQFGFMFRKEIF